MASTKSLRSYLQEYIWREEFGMLLSRWRLIKPAPCSGIQHDWYMLHFFSVLRDAWHALLWLLWCLIQAWMLQLFRKWINYCLLPLIDFLKLINGSIEDFGFFSVKYGWPDHQVEKLQGAKQRAAGWQTTACAVSPPRGLVTREMQTAGWQYIRYH